MVDVDIETTPISAWRTANQQVRLARGHQANCPLAITGQVEVPRLPPGPGRRSSAPAGSTPYRGRRSAIA
eukprot:2046842-Alexandrium_andersonii.AAC.1